MEDSMVAFFFPLFSPSHEKTCFIALVKEFVMSDYNMEL